MVKSVIICEHGIGSSSVIVVTAQQVLLVTAQFPLIYWTKDNTIRQFQKRLSTAVVLQSASLLQPLLFSMGFIGVASHNFSTIDFGRLFPPAPSRFAFATAKTFRGTPKILLLLMAFAAVSPS
jgi:hypothetical protein